MNHLKNGGDSTHKAVLVVYLTKLAFFQQGSERQDPAKNSFSQPVVNHDKLAVARSAITVQQKSITGGGDNTFEGPDQEVTDVAEEEKDMEAGAKTATSVNKEVAGGLGEIEVPVESNNAKQIPKSDITGGRENTVTGGSDLSLKGPDKEVTDGQGRLKIWKQVPRQQKAVSNEVNHSVGEKEVIVASEKAQQVPELEIAKTVDTDVANKNINTDASDPSQTEKVGSSVHLPKKH